MSSWIIQGFPRSVDSTSRRLSGSTVELVEGELGSEGMSAKMFWRQSSSCSGMKLKGGRSMRSSGKGCEEEVRYPLFMVDSW